MSDILVRAKEIERATSTTTSLYIKLSTLQDLIAEIERLRDERPLSLVRKKVEER